MHELINLTGQTSDLTFWLLAVNRPDPGRSRWLEEIMRATQTYFCTNNADDVWLVSPIFR